MSLLVLLRNPRSYSVSLFFILNNLAHLGKLSIIYEFLCRVESDCKKIVGKKFNVILEAQFFSRLFLIQASIKLNTYQQSEGLIRFMGSTGVTWITGTTQNEPETRLWDPLWRHLTSDMTTELTLRSFETFQESTPPIFTLNKQERYSFLNYKESLLIPHVYTSNTCNQYTVNTHIKKHYAPFFSDIHHKYFYFTKIAPKIKKLEIFILGHF